MRYSISVGVFAFAGVLFFSGTSFGKKLTNYEVLRAQVDTLSESVVNLLTAQRLKTLNWRSAAGETETFVRQGIEERLLRNNFRLSSDSTVAALLKVNVPVLKVEYSSPVASHIFASSDVERTIQSDYDVEIVDSGQVRFANSYTFVFADTVRQSDIPDLETGSYTFLHGRIDPGGFLDTMLQPVLFLASAAVVVYLFFTLRGS
jgi:hypothetical protein